MIKLLIGVALAGAAIAVWMLGVNALLVIVGIGAGVAFAELIDLGAAIEARKRAALAGDHDEDGGRSRR